MKLKKQSENPVAWIEATIKTFINSSPENSLKNETNDRAWADPLVGFSRGDDPLYQALKGHIGSFYWTPLEIFTKTFPTVKARPEELTVISWVLPHIETTKTDNRKQTAYPAERWVRARIYGEEANEKLRSHVAATVQQAGYEAVAPMLSPFFERKTSDRYGFASTWSERHAAYASGLGTFGLCDGLITPKGKAMRCGSVVARTNIPPTNRPYSDHHAYCLFFTKGLCGECIPRCPARAITEAGHDKVKCRDYLRSKVATYAKSHFGLEGEVYGCGLCQTGVPCESKIPTEDDVK
jgi:epoxyqueuosine reductase QueG